MAEPPTICQRKDRNFRYCTDKCPDITLDFAGKFDVYMCNYFHTEVIPKEVDLTECHP